MEERHTFFAHVLTLHALLYKSHFRFALMGASAHVYSWEYRFRMLF